MNGNRMKYASTPTYGMQKRGFQKKQAEKQAVPAPDFTQAPDRGATPAMPVYPPQPVPGIAPQFAQAPFAPVAPGIPMQQSGMPTGIPAQGGLPMQQGMPNPYGAPLYGGMSAPVYPYGTLPVNAALGQNLPPLQHQPNAAQQESAFSPRAQGYVPPQPQAASSRAIPASSFGASPQPIQNPLGTPQTFAPLPYPNPALGGTAYQGMGGAGGTLGGNAPYAGTPFANAPFGGAPGYPTDMIYPGYGQAAAKQRKPLDGALLVKLLLFVALPLLLVLGMLIPSLGVLRYVFVGLAVAGVALLWGLKMFQQSTRSAITIVFIALCCLALFGGGGAADSRQTSAGGGAATPVPTEAVIAVDETVAPVATPEPEVEVLGASEAEQRLSTFMDFWATSRVEDMVSYVQPSWATLKDSPAKELFNLLSNRTPLSYAIESISGAPTDTSRTITMSATIDKNNGKDPVTYRFLILMVKEDGNWYVDPNSLATNDVTEDPSATPTIGTMTAAPRVTVSPTPPPDTLLYYNPDGGSFYHSDQYCPSVKDEFLPLTGSFPYSELSAHKALQPCLQCGAPTE